MLRTINHCNVRESGNRIDPNLIHLKKNKGTPQSEAPYKGPHVIPLSHPTCMIDVSLTEIPKVSMKEIKRNYLQQKKERGGKKITCLFLPLLRLSEILWLVSGNLFFHVTDSQWNQFNKGSLF